MDTLKRYALSSLTSFLTGAFISLGVQFSSGLPIVWTSAFWVGVLIVAARAGVKAVIEYAVGQHADLPVASPAQQPGA